MEKLSVVEKTLPPKFSTTRSVLCTYQFGLCPLSVSSSVILSLRTGQRLSARRRRLPVLAGGGPQTPMETPTTSQPTQQTKASGIPETEKCYNNHSSLLIKELINSLKQ